LNIVLLNASQIAEDNTAWLSERAHNHIVTVLRLSQGATLRVGVRSGLLGRATIIEQTESATRDRLELTESAPPRQPVGLIMALPRPKMFRRILSTCIEMGIAELHFINSFRVEKSYWQSPLINSESIEKIITTGLEQACDTNAPDLYWHRRFKPFIEDSFDTVKARFDRCLLADHRSKLLISVPKSDESTLICIGPEGGFIPYEIERFHEYGCHSVHLGPRTLKSETAVAAILGKVCS